jgi:hypothetical protein
MGPKLQYRNRKFTTSNIARHRVHSTSITTTFARLNRLFSNVERVPYVVGKRMTPLTGSPHKAVLMRTGDKMPLAHLSWLPQSDTETRSPAAFCGTKTQTQTQTDSESDSDSDSCLFNLSRTQTLSATSTWAVLSLRQLVDWMSLWVVVVVVI